MDVPLGNPQHQYKTDDDSPQSSLDRWHIENCRLEHSDRVPDHRGVRVRYECLVTIASPNAQPSQFLSDGRMSNATST